MIRKASLALCAAALLSAAPFAASALEFKFNGAEAGFRPVTVDRTAPAGITNYNTSAGGFSMTDETVGGTLGNFIAWCFDLDTTISAGNTYTYVEDSTLLDDVSLYVAGAKDRIQKLFDSSYDPNTVFANSQKSAGFQIAIWELIYDDDYSLNSGNFTAGNSNALDEAATYLANANAYNSYKKWDITTYDSANAQDLGVAAAIPLPAAAWLLLGVSGALIAGKRRSARKNA